MATITQTGTANGVVQYTGDTTEYVPKAMIGSFRAINNDRIEISCGVRTTEWKFDNETQRDSAITTLLGYF